MDAPPISAANPTPDSVDSSPICSQNDSYDADAPLAPKLRLMCSYGGHIVPRPHDKSLCYIGGDTRIVVAERQTSLSELHARLSKNLLNSQPFVLKYQLPGEDLDSLISVCTDEDLENMVEEYDRLSNGGGGGMKRGRIRLFLFPKLSPGADQVVIENSLNKSEERFFNALNGKASLSTAASDRGFSESSSVNYLLGLDDDLAVKVGIMEKEVEAPMERAKLGDTGNVNVTDSYVINQDVHSIPSSPMLRRTSSFGSTSSIPSTNLPPTGLHTEENSTVVIDEQFQQISAGVAGNVSLPPPRKEEEIADFPAAGVVDVTMAQGSLTVVGDEYANRIIPEDERSDRDGYRKVQHIQPQVQPQLYSQQNSQNMQKQISAADLPSPDSVSSDGNAKNPTSKQIVHQESFKQIESAGNTVISSNQVDLKTEDQNCKVQMQHPAPESGYVSSLQCDQIHPQLHQPLQFLHAGNHYLPAGAMPIMPHYSVFPSQREHHPHQPVLDQPYAVYIMPMKPNQPYNWAVPQSHYSEKAPTSNVSQTPPAIATQAAFNQVVNVPSSNPEMVGGMCRAAAPQLVPMPPGQHQVHYVAFTQFPHLSQPAASPTGANYAYDFVDPSHPQIYPFPPQLSVQHQTPSAGPGMITSDSSAQHPSENIKQQ